MDKERKVTPDKSSWDKMQEGLKNKEKARGGGFFDKLKKKLKGEDGKEK